MLALINGIGALLTLIDAPFQYSLGLPYSPVVRAVANVFWATSFGWIAIRLWRRDVRAPRWIAPLLSAYGLWGVLWLGGFARSDYDRGRFPFQAVLTALLLIPFWWAHWRMQRTRRPSDAAPPTPE